MKKDINLNTFDLKDINILWQVCFKSFIEKKEAFTFEQVDETTVDMYKHIKKTQNIIQQMLCDEQTEILKNQPPF